MNILKNTTFIHSKWMSCLAWELHLNEAVKQCNGLKSTILFVYSLKTLYNLDPLSRVFYHKNPPLQVHGAEHLPPRTDHAHLITHSPLPPNSTVLNLIPLSSNCFLYATFYKNKKIKGVISLTFLF